MYVWKLNLSRGKVKLLIKVLSVNEENADATLMALQVRD